MITMIKIIDQIEDIGTCESFKTEQLVNSAIFGSSSGLMATFSENKVYKRGDKVPFLTGNGEILILVCNKDTVFGQFKAADWDEWNIVDEIESICSDLAILSWNEPSNRRNKIWIEIKNESLENARDLNLGNNTGILIYRNLIVSGDKPATMNEDVIWGKIIESD